MNEKDFSTFRRNFLKVSVMMALPGIFGCTGQLKGARTLASIEGLPPQDPPPVDPPTGYVPPTRLRGSTIINVRTKGAVGNGIVDDTKAFQAAIAALPADGGTVYVPTGNYLITPGGKSDNNSIKLRSKMHLQMAPDAVLISKASSLDNGFIIYCYKLTDVEISGGQIVGDRDIHLGTTGEWGHGIQNSACQRVTIRDIHISNCWGDGICVGGVAMYKAPAMKSEDVVIYKATCINNRRQGLSLTEVKNVKVYNSEFSYTNGTAPQCGIDVEPAAGNDCFDIIIDSCVMRGNHAYGVLMWKRSNNVTVRNCDIFENSAGIVSDGPTNAFITGNKLHNNDNNGVHVREFTNGVTINENTFYGNNSLKPRTLFQVSGESPLTAKDISVDIGAVGVRVLVNSYK
jgi:polygalacturonase